MPSLEPWHDFYVILGAAAGALIGLQFVVMTLVAEKPPEGAEEAGNAFSTPNVFHFSMALWLSLVTAAPWPGTRGALWTYVATGGFGLVYIAVVGWRMAHQQGYRPELVDWVSYVVSPALLYLVLTGGSVALNWSAEDGLMLIGLAAAGLLFVGVYNSWDAIAFMVARRAEQEDRAPPRPSAERNDRHQG
ncbi:hypothetical protein HMF7854_06180 [Sphingomonas ginkgonis]|uniref:Uncharacterized protein n=1 Tax=Sphingomonas ginkgonis TaxID=2315330 RepID=A0A3R9Y5C0_9SPHN|nr:hypothetical protein [Sphingomonas ginkgonis]RST30462.1 hypothetical protein HMF7854_06180 [Sphingomonas ginkgonis]